MLSKPFLFLAARAETDAADAEYEAVCRLAGLQPVGAGLETDLPELVRFQLTDEPLPPVNLADYSGIIIGGSPYNVSDQHKSELQTRVETDLHRVLDQAIAQDFPVLGLCYGLGLLGQHLGGIVDLTYGEPAGTVEVQLTEAGQADRLLTGIPAEFEALTGHNEAVKELPVGATLLATSAAAPIQMMRAGANVYAVQFHPELDVAGLTERLKIYLHKGYCAPEEYDQVVDRIQVANLVHAHQILRSFVTNYAAAGGDCGG